jgi:hypothetical protein
MVNVRSPLATGISAETNGARDRNAISGRTDGHAKRATRAAATAGSPEVHARRVNLS